MRKYLLPLGIILMIYAGLGFAQQSGPFTAQITRAINTLRAGTTWTGTQTFAVDPVLQAATVAPEMAGAGMSVVTLAAPRRVIYKVTLDDSHYVTNGLTQDTTITTLPAKTRLVGVYANVSEAFVLAASQLTLSCGTAAGGQQILVNIDADAATGWFGDADAELGASVNAAARVQDAYIPSFSATQIITVRLASDAANLGDGKITTLTAGSVTFYIITEVLP